MSNQILNHSWIDNRVAEYFRWYPNNLTSYSESDFQRIKNIENISGLYIHIPYCSEICKFCPYNKKMQNINEVDVYVESLIKELNLYSTICNNTDIEFIYFGGGTPSVLNIRQIEKIINEIRKLFNVRTDVEITLEAHPTHLTDLFSEQLVSTGINRISTGIQSFNDKILKSIGATHSASDSFKACEIISRYFTNAGIDLLYYCSNQTIEDWENDINQFLSFKDLKHISCYNLTLPNNIINNSPLEIEMAQLAELKLTQNLFSHYASCSTGGFDYAKKGYESKYETLHWKAPQAQYIGIGAGAIGFISDFTTVNIHSIKKYNEKLDKDILPLLSATIATRDDLMRRYFVLGVKTLIVDLNNFSQLYNVNPHLYFNNEFDLLKRMELITIQNDLLILTDVGRYYVDQISELFWSDLQKSYAHIETNDLIKFERTLTL